MIEYTQPQLRILLGQAKVNFEFVKNDGTTRKAFGTLCPEYIPENFKPKDSSANVTSLRFFDLEKNEWRSISKNVEKVNVSTFKIWELKDTENEKI